MSRKGRKGKRRGRGAMWALRGEWGQIMAGMLRLPSLWVRAWTN